MRVSAQLLLAILALVFFIPSPATAADVFEMKLSVDTNMNHHRNKGLVIFIDMLEKRSEGRIKVNFFHSAQLYKDRDIPKAMRLGTVDMGLPGIWQLEGVDPNAAITSLPMFFGLPEEVTKELIDGDVGKELNASLEKKLNVKTLGKWYYHGFMDVCSKNRPIKEIEDFKGLKIRQPGGTSNSLKLAALGASPVMIPWPDLPMAIVQGTADGFLTTFKSFDSAKLWETGAKYATADHEYYLNYIPMVSRRFWESLPPDLQQILLDVWEEHVPQQRQISDNEQAKGAENMKANGVEIYYPPEEKLAKWRAKVMEVQDDIVNEMGMDKDLVARVKKAVEAATQ